MTSKYLKVYHSQWGIYARKFWPDEIPDSLGVIYSFWDIGTDFKITTRDKWGDEEAAKSGWGTKTTQFDMMRIKTGKGIATELSIGGWTFSNGFSDACLTETSRAIFVKSIIDTFKKYPGVFKGCSLDWEYPSDKGDSIGYGNNITRVGDGDRLILTCKLLREQLNANGMSDFPISGFISADPNKLEGHLKVKELSVWMDELHVQGYDFADGNWGETTASHQCNLYPKPGITKFSCHESIQYFLSKGVPANKVHIGVAAYSRGHGNTDGFGKTSSGGANKWSSWEEGILDYRHIVEGGTGGFGNIPKFPTEPIWDDDMKAHYWYDPISRQLVSCDTPRSIQEKTIYAKQYGLGGVFIWESSGDIRNHNDPKSIMKAVKDAWDGSYSPPPIIVPPSPPPVVVPPPSPPPVVIPPSPPPVVIPPSPPLSNNSDYWKFLLLGLLVGAGISKLS